MSNRTNNLTLEISLDQQFHKKNDDETHQYKMPLHSHLLDTPEDDEKAGRIDDSTPYAPGAGGEVGIGNKR
ncbi:MAG: hypothetical protein J0H68_04895 [Sphingobacteriia bacterium]|nr:hypothetical protein [Sphingobacteriia bacterium]